MADPNALVVQGSALGTSLQISLVNDAGGNPWDGNHHLIVSGLSNIAIGDNAVPQAFGLWSSDTAAHLLATGNYKYNGTNWEFDNSSIDFTAAASAARTTSGTFGDFTARDLAGLSIYLNITAVSGTTPTLNMSVQAKDPVSGNYINIPGASFAQQTTTGLTMLQIAPGLAALANQTVNGLIPRTYRLNYTIGGTTPSFTFSVGISISQ